MKRILLLQILIYCYSLCIGQIAEMDFVKAQKYENNIIGIIDSIKVIGNNSKITYSHDNTFKCIHLTGPTGNTYLIDISYLDDSKGYIKFKKDYPEVVVFEIRGDGSGNEPYYLEVNKISGEKKFPRREE